MKLSEYIVIAIAGPLGFLPREPFEPPKVSPEGNTERNVQ